jgi:hypothetical protein
MPVDAYGVVRKLLNPGEFVNKVPLARPKTDTLPQQEYAERFLEYFQDLVPNPGQSALDTQGLPDDWKVLSHLANQFCSFARALDRPVHGHWSKRRGHAKQLLLSLSRAAKEAEKFLREHIWLETRTEVCGVRRDIADGTPSTLAKDFRELSQFLQTAKRLQSRVGVIRTKRKPKVDDDSNFYLFLMEMFMKHRGAQIETAIFQEIADYANAHFYAGTKDDKPLDRDDVRTRIRRFRARNSEFSQRVEADVLAYVQRETGTISIRKLAKA